MLWAFLVWPRRPYEFRWPLPPTRGTHTLTHAHTRARTHKPPSSRRYAFSTMFSEWRARARSHKPTSSRRYAYSTMFSDCICVCCNSWRADFRTCHRFSRDSSCALHAIDSLSHSPPFSVTAAVPHTQLVPITVMATAGSHPCQQQLTHTDTVCSTGWYIK